MATTKNKKNARNLQWCRLYWSDTDSRLKLIQFRSLGGSEAELLSDYPELTKDDLKAARTYYAQHPEEIDDAIAAEDAES